MLCIGGEEESDIVVDDGVVVVSVYSGDTMGDWSMWISVAPPGCSLCGGCCCCCGVFSTLLIVDRDVVIDAQYAAPFLSRLPPWAHNVVIGCVVALIFAFALGM